MADDTSTADTAAAEPLDPDAVPASFTTRELGAATVYVCTVTPCQFDTLDLRAAQQHARYGHFAEQQAAADAAATEAAATAEAPAETPAASPDTTAVTPAPRTKATTAAADTSTATDATTAADTATTTEGAASS